MSNLNPDQFLFHGTAMDVEGDRLLPASQHGKGSYWGNAGQTRGEPAQDHAWAHPDEKKAWDFAHDRVIHTALEDDWNPRARVYAVHPNEHQSPGHDASIPGEVKAPHFDVAKRIDTMPGRQGTFPEVNWNNHTLHTGLFSEDEDANHPSPLSEQFGHRNGRWGEEERTLGLMHRDAREEDGERMVALKHSRTGGSRYRPSEDDTPLFNVSHSGGFSMPKNLGRARKDAAHRDAVRWATP